MLNEEQIVFFHKNGYLHIEKCVDERLIINFRESFFDHLNWLFGLKLKSDFDSLSLGSLIDRFRLERGDKVKKLYHTAKFFNSYQGLFLQEEVKSIVGSLLQTKPSSTIISEYQFRFDVPGDRKYLHQWHQDSAYYPQDSSGENSLVLNIGIQNVSKDMGSPELVRCSQNEGMLNFVDNTGKYT